jgi:hypothetical protein
VVNDVTVDRFLASFKLIFLLKEGKSARVREQRTKFSLNLPIFA